MFAFGSQKLAVRGKARLTVQGKISTFQKPNMQIIRYRKENGGRMISRNN